MRRGDRHRAAAASSLAVTVAHFSLTRRIRGQRKRKKGNDGGGKKNGGGGGSKREKKKRGVTYRSVLKEKDGDNYDDADTWDEQDFDVGGKEGAEWGNNERDEGGDKDDNEESEEEE